MVFLKVFFAFIGALVIDCVDCCWRFDAVVVGLGVFHWVWCVGFDLAQLSLRLLSYGGQVRAFSMSGMLSCQHLCTSGFPGKIPLAKPRDVVWCAFARSRSAMQFISTISYCGVLMMVLLW